MQDIRTVILLRDAHIETVLNDECGLVLLACIRTDAGFRSTMQVLDTVAVFSGPGLLVCCATEDLLPSLERRFDIPGTPTHLLLNHGRVLDSLMGRTTAQNLISFVRPHLQGFLQASEARGKPVPEGKAREVPRGKRIKAP
ncbi:MAG TPA: hypothetical protein PLR71_00015 [Deltaproteobacteria bacterium]|nr:hypothetical protein [Deltaproteobacteria bacterium]HQI79915.1 hypothetical protein [Deltaproteobacteria bacterium]